MSPSITKADAAMLGRRAAQPVKQPGDLLAVWISGELRNPLNGPQYGRQKFAKLRYRIEWKERVALAVLEAHAGWRPRAKDVLPVAVTFHANVFNLFDSDGLQASLKPVRDALVECGVISGDADRDGHTFVYSQKIDRKNRGVEIRIRLADK